jgi:hypothetical protein
MFKFKDENKEANIIKATQMLNALQDSVESLDSIEVGVNFAQEDRAMDMSIITKFEDEDALKAYATHPSHLEVIDFIKQVVEYTKVVDYHI